MGNLKPNYQYATAEGVPLDEPGELVSVETRGRRQITVKAEVSDTNTRFVFEIDMGDGEWIEHNTFDSKEELAQTFNVSAARARLLNDEATEGETVDAWIGCS